MAGEQFTLNGLWSMSDIKDGNKMQMQDDASNLHNTPRLRGLSSAYATDVGDILDQVAPALDATLDSPAARDVMQFALELATSNDDVVVPTFTPSSIPPAAGFAFPVVADVAPRGSLMSWPITPGGWDALPNLGDEGSAMALLSPNTLSSSSRSPSPIPSIYSETSAGSDLPEPSRSKSGARSASSGGGKFPKPARGRKRQHQLAAMTPEQRELEDEIRMERNRQSARDCRVRKKSYIQTLQAEIAQYATQFAAQADAMEKLRKENERVNAQLARLRKMVEERARKEKLERRAAP